MRKNIFRYGDIVKIITPKLFIRCGYPLTLDIVKHDMITREQKNYIVAMLNKFEIYPFPDKSLATELMMNDDYLYDDIYGEVLRVMAKYVIRRNKWGGSDRTIYTEDAPHLLNIEGRVISKKVVVTGKYNCGCMYGDEYEAPTLSNSKVHVILELSINDHLTDTIHIEQSNVVKIDSTTNPKIEPDILLSNIFTSKKK